MTRVDGSRRFEYWQMASDSKCVQGKLEIEENVSLENGSPWSLRLWICGIRCGEECNTVWSRDHNRWFLFGL